MERIKRQGKGRNMYIEVSLVLFLDCEEEHACNNACQCIPQWSLMKLVLYGVYARLPS
jgi:hypothetical protein